VAGGTTHVDIDDVGASCLGDPGAFRHPAHLTAGKLNDVWSVTGGFTAEHGHRPPPDEIVAGSHLGNNEPCSQRFSKAPEGPVRDSRHRRKKTAVADGNTSNREWLEP
jgi:hypothetical protein